MKPAEHAEDGDSGGIRAVIFDMDGVLADSEALMARAAVTMFQERHGIRVRPEDFVPFVGTGEIRYLGSVAEQYGVILTQPDDKDYTYRAYLRLIPGNLRPLPGVLDFVARCRRAGMSTAVATGADRIKLDGTLSEIGLPPAEFDVLVTGSDITRPKPDPEIFLRAAAAMDLVPSSCLVVEDAIHGIRAAQAGGFPCMALTTTFPAERLAELAPTWLYPDLAGALDAWATMFEKKGAGP